jgi:hypothetical protein
MESVGELVAAEDFNCCGFSLDAGWLGWVTVAAAATFPVPVRVAVLR